MRERTAIDAGLANYIKTSIVPVKLVIWIGDSRKRVREFPDRPRARAGFELWAVQQGYDPSDWKPMSLVGPGVHEIRVHGNGEYRVIYIARFEEAIYVLHAFEKKTRRTSRLDLDLARHRFRVLISERTR
jgi:phage-related protein